MIERKPFIIERRTIAPRQRQTRARDIYEEHKTIVTTGRIAREISRALRTCPLRFPRDWIAK